MTDYYTTLGVTNTASQDDIKKAFRKLAFSNHPDKGGDVNTFQKIQEAYETLSDPEKRKLYDAPQQPPSYSFPFEFGGLHGFHPFAQFMQQQNYESQIAKKPDREFLLKITLDDVFYGKKKKFKVSRDVLCLACHAECKQCNGTGKRVIRSQIGNTIQITHGQCSLCNGTGSARINQCSNCDSKGVVCESDIFEIDIPRGVENGKSFVFEGWGCQATNKKETPGNLVVKVHVEEHGVFKRAGNDLMMTVTLTLRESLLGKSLDVPHFEKSFNINTKGFGIINPNKQYTIFEKGLVNNNGDHGQLHIRFNIIYPEKTLNNDEIKVLTLALDNISI